MNSDAITFRYRYVGFGTVFSPAPGPRPPDTSDPDLLYENEIAVDIGSRCFDGHATAGSAPLFVFDHHFRSAPTGENFPAASAAVLCHAGALQQRFAGRSTIWLVAHEQPDFDAFCAMYLARCAIEESATAAACERLGLCRHSMSYWLDPDLAGIDETARSLVLLAANAARVDQALRLRTPRTRALHSILYAAMKRGRALEATGAREFFDEARAAIVRRGLNPLFDAVLDERSSFALEISLLEREEESYRRDIARARRSVVNLQTHAGPFSAWFARLAARPFLQTNGAVDPAHLQPSGPATVQADGVYLRDPESILFKEWARGDHENSPSGRGFFFTAIAASGEITDPGASNSTRYWFSLDMERARADGCHLYNVWAALQAAEIAARKATHDSRLASGEERTDFAGRQVGADPWYDGNAFEATILDTPRGGTALAPGTRSDLGDDIASRIVRECLDYSWFQQHGAECRDFPTAAPSEAAPSHEIDLTRALEAEPRAGCLRFCQIAVCEGVDLLCAPTAEQIGRLLWPVLERRGVDTLPMDFFERHLIVERDSVIVWNRRGIAIAHQGEAGAAQSRELAAAVEKMAATRRDVRQLIEADPATAPENLLARSETLTRSLAAIQLDATQPERTALRRFFDASRFGEVHRTVRGLHEQAAERTRQHHQSETTARMDANLHTIAHVQTVLEWIEIFLVSVYAAELTHMFTHEPLLVALAAAVGGALTAWGVLATVRQKVSVTAIALAAFLILAALLNPGEKWIEDLVDTPAQVNAIKASWALLMGVLILLLVGSMRRARKPALPKLKSAPP